MYCIDKDILLHLNFLVFSNNVEYCSVFEEGEIVDGHQKLEYSFQDEKRGFKLDNRQGCATDKKSIYKVHTHPFGEHSYPSPEDLLLLVQYKNMKLSVIATNWGVYMIKQTDRKLNYFDTLKDRLDEVLHSLNNYIHEYLGYVEEQLGGRETPHQLVDEAIPDVNNILDFLSNDLGLDIKLYPWKDLLKDNKRQRDDDSEDKPKIKRKRKM